MLSLMVPGDAATMAHCRRVAAVSNLIGHHLLLRPEQKRLLSSAALLHHSGGAFPGAALERLLRDVCQHEVPLPNPVECLPEELRNVLEAFEAPGGGSTVEKKLAEIARLADAFDQEMEALPLEGGMLEGVFQALEDGAEGGLWSEEILAALRDSTDIRDVPPPANWRVPVFPAAAARILRLLDDPQASIPRVIDAAGSDPGVGAAVMRLANSALFGSAAGCSTLRQAIVRLGFATARKTILAATVRPLFRSGRLDGLWPHSVEVADLAEQLATAVAPLDPAEAFITGLLHDAGRIALLDAPLYHSARLEGLARAGCPAVYAESLILRTDHAALGGAVAASWNLPEKITAAIALHHRPEAAAEPLAHILYLAEFLSGAEEDLPSHIRLQAALRTLGIRMEELMETTVSGVGAMLAA
jgi:HD-like signal output (HDOD) protein